MLCGVEIDHPQGLAGHSDADVGAHALMDALLGAAGLGDIGELFPDTDRGVRRRLEHRAPAAASSLAWREAGWRVAQRRRHARLRAPAPRGLSAGRCASGWPRALGLAGDAVSVKATTTEGMGFEGRGEGIAALAVCLLSR